MSGRDRTLSPAETAAFLSAAIDPHIDEIAEIAERGEVAVVFHEIEPESERHFRAYGYPETKVLPLPERLRVGLRNLPADPLTRRWLDSPREGVVRVLLFVHAGSLLLNFHEERGWWIEADSVDGMPA